jgi:hypothetical protein
LVKNLKNPNVVDTPKPRNVVWGYSLCGYTKNGVGTK